MFSHHRPRSERDQLELFRALPGDLAPRDAQDLMAYPFFSLAKTHRTTPIDYRVNEVAIRVEAVPEHGMATIWDADVLIWAASQIVAARDAGLPTSRLLATTPREMLTFTGRGTSARDYHRLAAAMDRLQSTTVATSLRQARPRQLHRFSWINEWRHRANPLGQADGIDFIVPDWFYRAVLDDSLILTIDRAYFGLTGGLERWLYRLVRKHAGTQRAGWRFDFRHLHAKSASLSPYRRFAFELRELAHRQRLPGYRLAVRRASDGGELLSFGPAHLSTEPVDNLWNSTCYQEHLGTCYQEQGHVLSGTKFAEFAAPDTAFGARNLDSNLRESNSYVAGLPHAVDGPSGGLGPARVQPAQYGGEEDPGREREAAQPPLPGGPVPGGVAQTDAARIAPTRPQCGPLERPELPCNDGAEP